MKTGKGPRAKARFAGTRGGFAAALVCYCLACCLSSGWALNEGAGGPWAGARGEETGTGYVSLLEWPGVLGWSDEIAFQELVRLSAGPASRPAGWDGARGPLELKGEWTLGRGALLSSQHRRHRNDRPFGFAQDGPDEKNWGLSTTETTHTLSLSLGGSSQITASLADETEGWNAQLRGPGLDRLGDSERRTRSMELRSNFGGGPSGVGSVRLAVDSVEMEKEGQQQWERRREAQLSLTPMLRLGSGQGRKLRLNAEHLSKGSPQHGEETTSSVAAMLELAPEAELGAGMKTVAAEQGGASRESFLKLSAKVGGGSSVARLAAEEKVRGTEEAAASSVRERKWRLSGALGPRVRVSAEHEETLRLDRLRRSSSGQGASGTNAAPEVSGRLSCELTAELGPETNAPAGLRAGRTRRGWRSLHFRAKQQLSREGGSESSELSYAVEARRGELPKWAEPISRGHEFPEAPEYLVLKERFLAGQAWPEPEMAFAGYRLWATRRSVRATEQGGRDSFGFAYRGIVGGRYQVRVAHLECPKAESGEEQGQALVVRRELVEVGTEVSGGLSARAGYQTERSLSTPGVRRRGVALGVWGPLSERERVEVSVCFDLGQDKSHDAGRWEEGVRAASRVSLLYFLRVNEEHQVSVKVGYGWGEREAGGVAESPDRERECRFTLGYEKPI